MKKLKKISFVLSCILLIMSITHYVLFPQETQCMLISFSTFEQKGGFYARKEIADTTRHKIAQIMLLAEKRVAALYFSATVPGRLVMVWMYWHAPL